MLTQAKWETKISKVSLTNKEWKAIVSVLKDDTIKKQIEKVVLK